MIRQADAQLYNSLRQKRIYIEIVTDKTTVRSQLELKTNCTESTHLGMFVNNSRVLSCIRHL